MASDHLHEFNFGFGEAYSHYVIPFRDIEELTPDGPGLYSWHFRLPRKSPEKASKFLRDLFQDSTIDVTASANMRQKWEGKLRTAVDPFGEDVGPALNQAFFAIAYPLYIGISVDLRTRLRTHKRQLEQFLQSSYEWLNGEIIGDSDEESKCFGHRLGSVFANSSFNEIELLYVKCMSFEELADGSHLARLREVERTCNTLFHPVFGRR